MNEKCKMCPDWLFCQMHGCTIWNPEARAKYRREREYEEAHDPIDTDNE